VHRALTRVDENWTGASLAEAAWRADGLPVAELCRYLRGFCYLAEQADRATFLQAMGSGASVMLLVAHRRGADVLTRGIRSGLRDRLLEVFANPTNRFAGQLAQCLAGIDLANAKAIRRTQRFHRGGAISR
jgi:hypothetical protein